MPWIKRWRMQSIWNHKPIFTHNLLLQPRVTTPLLTCYYRAPKIEQWQCSYAKSARKPVIHLGIFMIISLSLSSNTSIDLFCGAVVRLTGAAIVAFGFTYTFSYSSIVIPKDAYDSCIWKRASGSWFFRFLVHPYKSSICLYFLIDQNTVVH